MPIPIPQPGLVISYVYLWHHEHRAGQEEGLKTRPYVIVLATERAADGNMLVRVAPITHSAPGARTPAIELPPAVRRHLALDESRSWVILDEINEFVWPGLDLRPVARSRDSFAFGFLPPRLFEQLVTTLRSVWSQGQGKATRRD